MEFRVLASGSDGNAYKVSDGNTALLLDAGIPFKSIQKALQFRVRDIAGCLVTHEHGDHCKAVEDLAHAGMDIYASKGTFEAKGFSGHRMRVVESLKQFTVGTFLILPFDVEHDAAEPLGFLLHSMSTGEKLLYFTDTYYLRYKFSGLTVIAGECNHSIEAIHDSVANGLIPEELVPRLVRSHMSIENFLGFIEANDMSTVKQIYLIHISKNNGDPESFRKLVQKAVPTAEVYVC